MLVKSFPLLIARKALVARWVVLVTHTLVVDGVVVVVPVFSSDNILARGPCSAVDRLPTIDFFVGVFIFRSAFAVIPADNTQRLIV